MLMTAGFRVGLDDDDIVDGSGGNADTGVGPLGEIAADFLGVACHAPLAAVAVLLRFMRFLTAWRDWKDCQSARGIVEGCVDRHHRPPTVRAAMKRSISLSVIPGMRSVIRTTSSSPRAINL